MQNNFNEIINSIDNIDSDIKIMINKLKETSKIEESVILKSTIILMLYNEVEGTFSNILTTLFDYIYDNDIKFNQLNKNLQKIYLKYYLKKINSNVNNLSSFYNNANLTQLDYLELTKFLKLYSGNLDAKQIREISNKLGVTISDTIKGEHLLIIKDKRNCLAHGEKRFSEACRDLTEKEVIEMSTECSNYLKMITNDFDIFIEYQLIQR